MQAHGSMALRSFAAPVRAFRAAPAVSRCVSVRPVAALQSSFLGTPCSVRSICSSFTGLTLAPARRPGTVAPRGPVKIEANSKTCIGCTKRGTRRRAARTSGFKARMQTPAGRKVLQARRKKGRKVLCPCSLYKKK